MLCAVELRMLRSNRTAGKSVLHATTHEWQASWRSFSSGWCEEEGAWVSKGVPGRGGGEGGRGEGRED